MVNNGQFDPKLFLFVWMQSGKGLVINVRTEEYAGQNVTSASGVRQGPGLDQNEVTVVGEETNGVGGEQRKGSWR